MHVCGKFPDGSLKERGKFPASNNENVLEKLKPLLTLSVTKLEFKKKNDQRPFYLQQKGFIFVIGL